MLSRASSRVDPGGAWEFQHITPAIVCQVSILVMPCWQHARSVKGKGFEENPSRCIIVLLSAIGVENREIDYVS
jgi:hypothetical protein